MGGGALVDRDIFSIYGPSHLTSIDWTNSYHRTSVAASLVKGVYTLERDRQEKRVGSESRAKPWWEFFHFTLLETLIDGDGSIYGAIFEYELYNIHQNSPHVKIPPRHVIAFRGTILKTKTFLSDAKNDLRCIFNNLHRGSRSMHAIKAIHNMMLKYSDSAIWLAGHSLGAALALLAGKTMKISGFFLESYIFNPPISSIPLEQLPGGNKFKGVFRLAKSIVKATVAMTFMDLEVQEDDPKAASWIPYLYVNASDPICSEYIGYYRHKTYMSEIGASKIERTGGSLGSLLVGRKGTSSPSDLSTEPLHHLSSADMTVNMNKPTKSVTAHGLHQWWEQDSALRANWRNCCIRPCPEDKFGKL